MECCYSDVVDFDSVDDLCNEIINNVLNEQDYTTCTVVADNNLATELVHKILAIKDSFDLVTDCNIDTLGFYYVTVDSKCDVYCKLVINDNIPFLNESNYTYVQENVPEFLEKYFGNEYKLIFGISE